MAAHTSSHDARPMTNHITSGNTFIESTMSQVVLIRSLLFEGRASSQRDSSKSMVGFAIVLLTVEALGGRAFAHQ
eukprot:2979411-Amphidinium_carterae.1